MVLRYKKNIDTRLLRIIAGAVFVWPPEDSRRLPHKAEARRLLWEAPEHELRRRSDIGPVTLDRIKEIRAAGELPQGWFEWLGRDDDGVYVLINHIDELRVTRCPDITTAKWYVEGVVDAFHAAGLTGSSASLETSGPLEVYERRAIDKARAQYAAQGFVSPE